MSTYRSVASTNWNLKLGSWWTESRASPSHQRRGSYNCAPGCCFCTSHRALEPPSRSDVASKAPLALVRAKAPRKHHVEAVTANVSFTNTTENKEKTRTSLDINYLLDSDPKALPKLLFMLSSSLQTILVNNLKYDVINAIRQNASLKIVTKFDR